MMKNGINFVLNVDARRTRLATAVGESHIDPKIEKQRYELAELSTGVSIETDRSLDPNLEC